MVTISLTDARAPIWLVCLSIITTDLILEDEVERQVFPGLDTDSPDKRSEYLKTREARKTRSKEHEISTMVLEYLARNIYLIGNKIILFFFYILFLQIKPCTLMSEKPIDLEDLFQQIPNF